jgi:hypothetical protein
VPSADRAVLVTDAPESPAQQRADRTRRYSLLMGGRLVLFVLAGLAYPLSSWLAVGPDPVVPGVLSRRTG